MIRAVAPAKINLALVVGPRRDDGRHEVTTVLQRVDLSDRVSLRPAADVHVMGFRGDTLVREALKALAGTCARGDGWEATIEKRIPVSSGLGGGSSDAATALRLANETLAEPLDAEALTALARPLGADVPFFLTAGPQLGERDGTTLTPLELPQDYWVLLVAPRGRVKSSTAAVYEAFDARGGSAGYRERRAALLEQLASVRRTRDLATLPRNDLASSPLADELVALGAVRADVSGAGPIVYAIFQDRSLALAARRRLRGRGKTWLTVPAWYF